MVNLWLITIYLIVRGTARNEANDITLGFTQAHDLLARFSPQRRCEQFLGGAPAVQGVTNCYVFLWNGPMNWLVFAVHIDDTHNYKR
jgi:hypothetical protein